MGSDPTEPEQVVTSGALDSHCPDKDGEQTPRHNFSTPPPSEQGGSASPRLMCPDSVIESESYVLVDPPAIPSGPGNRSVRSVGPPNNLHHLHSAVHATLAFEKGKEARPSETHSILRQSQHQGPQETQDPTTKPTSLAERREEVLCDHIPNIVIFGEAGVGKSSIINLIADEKLAGTSNDAVGYTFQHERYPIVLGDVSCALWDTAGLDEGTEGTVPANIAEENLRRLMRALARSGGIHLIIYCVRGTRLTKGLKRNYDLFYVSVCRKQVPVALVVTGLEYELGEMEAWWDKNETALGRYGMRFDAHACVTTLDINDPTTQQRRSDSQVLLRELVVEYSRHAAWTIDPSFISSVLPAVRTFFHGVSSLAGSGNTSSVRKVVICDSFADGCSKRMERIGDKQYEFIRLNKRTIRPEELGLLESYRGTGVGLLVFYASPPVDHQISPDDANALKRFFEITGGQPRRVVVILDCDNQKLARIRRDLSSRHNIQARTVSLPNVPDGTLGRLDTIQRWYPGRVEFKNPDFFKDLVASWFSGLFSHDDPGPGRGERPRSTVTLPEDVQGPNRDVANGISRPVEPITKENGEMNPAPTGGGSESGMKSGSVVNEGAGEPATNTTQ